MQRFSYRATWGVRENWQWCLFNCLGDAPMLMPRYRRFRVVLSSVGLPLSPFFALNEKLQGIDILSVSLHDAFCMCVM